MLSVSPFPEVVTERLGVQFCFDSINMAPLPTVKFAGTTITKKETLPFCAGEPGNIWGLS